MATIQDCLNRSGISAEDMAGIDFRSQIYQQEGRDLRTATVLAAQDELRTTEDDYFSALGQVRGLPTSPVQAAEGVPTTEAVPQPAQPIQEPQKPNTERTYKTQITATRAIRRLGLDPINYSLVPYQKGYRIQEKDNGVRMQEEERTTEPGPDQGGSITSEAGVKGATEGNLPTVPRSPDFSSTTRPKVENKLYAADNGVQQLAKETGIDISDTNLEPIDVRPASAPKFVHALSVRSNIVNAGRNLANKVKANVNNLDIIIADKPSDLDTYPSIRNAMYNSDGSNTALSYSAGGYFISQDSTLVPAGQNVVVMFADQYGSDKQLIQDMYHEIVGHYGIREILGKEDWKNFIGKILTTNRKATAAAFNLRERWAPHYLQKDQTGSYTLTKKGRVFVRGTKAQGYVQVRPGLYADSSVMGQLMDEYIAEEAKRYSDPNVQIQEAKVASFIKRVIAFIRHKMRAVLGIPLTNTVTDNDISSLLGISYRAYIEGDPVTNLYKKSRKLVSEGQTEESLTKMIQKVEPEYVPIVPTDIKTEHFIKSVKDHPIDDKIDALLDNTNFTNSLVNTYRSGVESITNKIRSVLHYGGMSTINDRQWVNRLERKGIGQANVIDRKARRLEKEIFKPLEKNGDTRAATQLLEMWKDGTIRDLAMDDNNQLTKEGYLTLPEDFRKAISYNQMKLIKDWNEDLIANQEFFIDRGYLSQGTELGTYVPRMYKEYADKYKGSGWAPSNLDWRKKITNLNNAQHLTPIKDPKAQIIMSVMQLGHDSAKFNLFANLTGISEAYNKGWVLGRGKKEAVTLERTAYFDMSTDADVIDPETVTVSRTHSGLSQIKVRLEDALANEKATAEDKLKFKRNIEVLDGAIARLEADMLTQQGVSSEQFNKDYVFVDPRKYRSFGDLRGTYVHKEIWNELFGDGENARFDGAAALVQSILTVKGSKGVEKANAMWKATKTMWNVPGYWTRAFVGTAMTVDMATDTSSGKMAINFAKELHDTLDQANAEKFAGKTLMQWALENGAGGTSIGEAELHTLLKDAKSSINLADIKAGIKDIETGKTNWFKTGALGFQLMTSKFASATEYLSNKNANMDLFFRLSLMRDFVNNWQKSYKGTSASIGKLSVLDTDYLMQKAAEYASNGVPEYNINIGSIAKATRRGIFGTPFLTFNYKLAGMFGSAILNRPQKFIKYPLLGWMIMSGIQALSGMSDDEYDDAIANMPYWTKDKSAVLPLPFKDNTGQMSYVDLSYVIPPAFYIDMARSLIAPQPTESRLENALSIPFKEFGMFGGLIPQVITATISGKNPFTNRDITSPGMSTSDKAKAYAEYLWNLTTIPSLTTYGAIADIMNQAQGQLTDHGLDKQSVFSDIITNLGISVTDYRPAEQAEKNAAYYRNLRKEVAAYRNKALRNPNLSVDDKRKAIAESIERTKVINQQQFGNR